MAKGKDFGVMKEHKGKKVKELRRLNSNTIFDFPSTNLGL